jgi:hypothetical protein
MKVAIAAEHLRHSPFRNAEDACKLALAYRRGFARLP